MNQIHCGDALYLLKLLEANSIDLILTSPPYFGQREYGEDTMEIGQENSLDFYLQRLCIIFRECVRVCKPTGNIVFNLGDIFIDNCLQLIPYKFAEIAIRQCGVKLVNEITWVKSNPVPKQCKKRLIRATEPFFHFVKSEDYYFDLDSYLSNRLPPILPPVLPSSKKGAAYFRKIEESALSDKEKDRAKEAVIQACRELSEGLITDFRMKIRGVHKKAFGGQAGGRNNQIDKQGYTLIRMHGNKLKRDVIESSVAQTKGIDHSAVYPLQVINEIISLLSPEKGLVLDPFCGSGQTCVAAKELGRQYFGIDLYPQFCLMAKQRLK